MADPTAFALGCALFGMLLVTMTLGGTFVARLPMSAAMLYLVVGLGTGSGALGIIDLRALRDAVVLERLSEVAVLVSLFTSGMKLQVPLRDARWHIPVRLASISMLLTVAGIAAIGVLFLHLSLGLAVLLGAILSPTDPVLASDVQVDDPADRDRLRFGLTGEGGLNDGSAFPFVMLGLGLMGLHDLGHLGWRWLVVDVLWSIVGGLAIGWISGMLVGRAVILLRMRHKEGFGSEEFIAFGLIAMTYGVALLSHTYGFLAVFAAGLSLQRIEARPPPVPQEELRDAPPEVNEAPAHMMREVQRFNSQLERFAEVIVVLAVGSLLWTVHFRWDALLLAVPLFLVIRPLAVYLGLLGAGLSRRQQRLSAWFGIRGVGSVYYVAYAIGHGVPAGEADRLVSWTMTVIVTSIIVHGVSVTPLMQRYRERRGQSRKTGNGTADIELE